MAREVAVLGVGMHPWGKWGRNFVEYGVAAAQAALADAGIPWTDVQFVAGGETIRNGYPGYVAGASIAQALGWNGAQVTSSYGACASGSQAIAMARAQILAGLCDVALVVGNDQMEVFTGDHIPAFAVFWGDFVEGHPRSPEFLKKLDPAIARAELDRTPAEYTQYPCSPALGRSISSSSRHNSVQATSRRRRSFRACSFKRFRAIPNSHGRTRFALSNRARVR